MQMPDLEFTINPGPGGLGVSTFQGAISGAIGILREYDSALSHLPRGGLKWVVSNLASNGDFKVAFRSKPRTAASEAALFGDLNAQVSSNFISGLHHVESLAVLPPLLSEQGLSKVQALGELVGKDGAAGFEFRHKNESIVITEKTSENASKLLPIKRTSLGSVEGTLEAVNLHKRAKFVVYQSVTSRAITCFFDKDVLLKTVKDSLTKRVIVSGILSKNVNGDTLRVNATTMRVLGEKKARLIDISHLADPEFCKHPRTVDYLREIRD